ncbi:hypothetical protein [Helicobacter pylori]|uniref:hypothetical protein n=1 Tax=Helicobacter pylori TaxID=210 RepID=UPI001304521A|nr:hypothetical protein [Helicobacter pylori]
MDLENVANDTLTPSKNYPMTATISVGAIKTNNKAKNRLCLFLNLLDKHGEVWCSGVWNLENKDQETIQQELEDAIVRFTKEEDPNRN